MLEECVTHPQKFNLLATSALLGVSSLYLLVILSATMHGDSSIPSSLLLWSPVFSC